MAKFYGMLMIAATVAVLAAVMVSCEQSPPKVNGKNVLTLDQYNQLMKAMSENGANGKDAKNGKNGKDAQTAAPGQASMDDGAQLFKTGQYAKAAAAFQAIVGKEPENSRAWFMLGNAYEKAGQLEQAQTAYKTSYDLMVKKGYIPEIGNMM